MIKNTRLTSRPHRLLVAGFVGAALLISGCAADAETPTPWVITATPPPIPTHLPPSEAPPPTDEPTPAVIIVTATPDADSVPLTPLNPPTDSPTSTPQPAPEQSVATPLPPNRLKDPGFEGAPRRAGFDAVNVVEDWQAFYCAEPYTDEACGSVTRNDGSGSDAFLRYSIPEFDSVTTGGRVHGGAQSQQWYCEYRTCQGGVYQVFPTTPGEVCEVGAWVQSYSSEEDGDPFESDLRTEDSRDSSTWYVRIDPSGGSFAWKEPWVVSRPFGYADGIYDQYARISTTFVATGNYATLYIENVRLWPLKNNFNWVDDAFAYCSMPDETALPTYPTADGLQVGGPDAGGTNGAPGGSSDIVRVGDSFWLYHDLRLPDGRGGIGLATSEDGINWTPAADGAAVFTPSESGWDSSGVSQPTVIYDEAAGRFQMWYLSLTDTSDPYSFAFGYATSEDGINWTREGSQPVVMSGAPGAWDEERIDGPDVIKVDGTYFIYYAATSLQPDFRRRIGCQTSENGVDWSPCGSPVISPMPELAAFEGPETEQPNLVYHDGLWLMAYTGYLGPQGENFRIGLAASYDGRNWERLFDHPVIDWIANDDSTSAPIIYFDAENGSLWLWYRLRNNGDSLQVLRLPVTWE